MRQRLRHQIGDMLLVRNCKDRESFHYQKPIKMLFVDRRRVNGDKWAKFNADLQKM